MAGWTRREIGGLPIFQADALAAIPGVVHGFTTRHGGVSVVPYNTLNLGLHVGDDPASVEANRLRLWDGLGFSPGRVTLAEQVHGNQVAVVDQGGGIAPGADALVTNSSDLLLMLFFADCVPVYIVDPVTRSVALIHSGWRGTVSGVVTRAVATLRESFGARPETCLAAVGPGIGGESYEVGPEVMEQFRRLGGAVSADAFCRKEGRAGRFALDLRRVILSQLVEAGIRPDHVSVSEEDTCRRQEDFFSFRRDGKGSGRMAGFLALRTLGAF